MSSEAASSHRVNRRLGLLGGKNPGLEDEIRRTQLSVGPSKPDDYDNESRSSFLQIRASSEHTPADDP
jgi:hypothetical protein